MQISAPRPPQTPMPARPDANPRMTAAALTAAMATATAGDSVEISSAARAASNRLIASTPSDAQSRAPLGEQPPAPLDPFRPDLTATAGKPGPPPTSGTPRWEHLPYAPTPLVGPPRPDFAATGPDLSRFVKTTVIAGATVIAILIWASVT